MKSRISDWLYDHDLIYREIYLWWYLRKQPEWPIPPQDLSIFQRSITFGDYTGEN